MFLFCRLYNLPLFIIYAIFFSLGCSSTKYVPKDRYLLNKSKVYIIGDKERVKKEDIVQIIQIRENKKWLNLFRFQLWLYNLSSPDTSLWLNNWFRKMGESPVIYDPFEVDQAKYRIKKYLNHQGYFHAYVSDTIFIKKKKVTVRLTVRTGSAKLFGKTNYIFEDSTLREIILLDTLNSLIKTSSPFSVETLENERIRIEKLIRNNGYFNFSRDKIYFLADTLSSKALVNITVGVRMDAFRDSLGFIRYEQHRKYKINDIQIWVDNQRSSDTLLYPADKIMYDVASINDIYYFYRDFVSVRPHVLHNQLKIKKNSLYRQDNIEETYRNLSALRTFKFVNIGFTESKRDTNIHDTLYRFIDCKIQLIPSKYQSYQTEFEFTNRFGFGVAGNFNYQHRNLFKGAEVFNFRLKGNTEAVKSTQSFMFKNTLELGFESSLTIPKSIIPFPSLIVLQRHSPRTSFTASYNYLRRIQYTHQISTLSYGIHWIKPPFSNYQINLLDVNYVRILQLDSVFYSTINNIYQRHSFHDHFIIASALSYVYNTQTKSKKNTFHFIRFNSEFAGNTTYALMKLMKIQTQPDQSYKLFNIRYAQYLKWDFDYRYYWQLDANNKIVFRLFAGIAYPYGNSRTIPFQKQYFAGGVNSMRAWTLRSLGPGSYKDTIQVEFPDKTGDIKIENNLEWRYKLFWKFEGAIFLDIGNIWSINTNDTRSDAIFDFSNFINQFAIGTGTGLRLNFSLFIVRLDLGVKLKDPSEKQNLWVISKLPFIDLINPTFGIGYPF